MEAFPGGFEAAILAVLKPLVLWALAGLAGIALTLTGIVLRFYTKQRDKEIEAINRRLDDLEKDWSQGVRDLKDSIAEKVRLTVLETLREDRRDAR